MTNISTIANQLADLYRVRKGCQVSIDKQRTDLEARQLAITPAEGWPGKNEEARGIARDRAFTSDEVCQKINEEISSMRDDLADIEADCAALEIQFSAAKYEITYMLALGLGANKHEPRTEQATAAAVEKAQEAATVGNGADDWHW